MTWPLGPVLPLDPEETLRGYKEGPLEGTLHLIPL